LVKVTYDAMPCGGIYIALQGHAGAGPAGDDPVCAALSMLIYTAAGVAREAWAENMLSREPYIRIEKGSSELLVCPEEGRSSWLRDRLGFVDTGFFMLAESFPEHVQAEGGEL